jgi:hypothetical protein
MLGGSDRIWEKMENSDLEVSIRWHHTSYFSVPFVLEYMILFRNWINMLNELTGWNMYMDSDL